MNEIITGYEHQDLPIDSKSKLWQEILRFHSKNGDKFFGLRHNGIKLKHYVGIIRFNSVSIQILPKIDRESENAIKSILLDILIETNPLQLIHHGTSFQRSKEASILDYYFLLFLNNIEKLLHQGLNKRYNFVTINSETLKGKVLFSKTIKENAPFVHKHVQKKIDYNIDNLENRVVKLTLKLISRFSRTLGIRHQAQKIYQTLDKVSDISSSNIDFKLIYKLPLSNIYKDTLKFSEIIISGFLPDLNAGVNESISLLFDMNRLFEKLVLKRLQKLSKQMDNLQVSSSRGNSKRFWRRKLIKPDIIIKYKGSTFILDTKWKVPNPFVPSDNDIKQMFVYGLYYNSYLNVLVYPKSESAIECADPYNGEFKDFTLASYPVELIRSGKLSNSFGKDLLNYIAQYNDSVRSNLSLL